MKIPVARRMQSLAPYLFADLDRIKREALSRGVDVISFTIGDPDLPTPDAIVRAGQAAMADPRNHRYPAYAGSDEFRSQAAAWMKRRFGVDLDAECEIAALIGTKEGIAHLPLAFIDPGDLAMCPEPGYPVYATATRLAGGRVHYLPLEAKNGFLPDLDAVAPELAARARMLWINYPNNPTGAPAGREFLERAVAFCRRHEILLCSDCAYSEIVFDGRSTQSVLQIDGARDVAIEFHSLSKSYNMTGWRVGFVAGNATAVGALATLKSNLDSGVAGAMQQAGIAAMRQWPENLEGLLASYRRRRDLLVDGLIRLGFEPPRPIATFYVWMPVPGGDDIAFAARLIERAGVLVTPGSGFGPSGRGYVRLTLTLPEERITKALERLREAGIGGGEPGGSP
ncbi:MAG TPA: LL-diaminopimelate aminotransferase [Myxococcota bacterium]|nr:LL-diaminopimelate aminotransferase [Myxococcota bacterium]